MPKVLQKSIEQRLYTYLILMYISTDFFSRFVFFDKLAKISNNLFHIVIMGYCL